MMKSTRIYIWLAIALMLTFAAAVIVLGSSPVNANAASGHDFVELYSGGYGLFSDLWRIVYYEETKVMYYMSNTAASKGAMTMLVNPDGTPLVWNGE